jgi:hypothetical protein
MMRRDFGAHVFAVQFELYGSHFVIRGHREAPSAAP